MPYEECDRLGRQHRVARETVTEILAQRALVTVGWDQNLDSLAEFVTILRNDAATSFVDHWETHLHPSGIP